MCSLIDLCSTGRSRDSSAPFAMAIRVDDSNAEHSHPGFAFLGQD